MVHLPFVACGFASGRLANRRAAAYPATEEKVPTSAGTAMMGRFTNGRDGPFAYGITTAVVVVRARSSGASPVVVTT
ncbi:hypothetical protein CIW52_30955 [Mycolicibacterium sp. P9-64]|nr:hypothetical protein CIW52_30955 [Mycolicibacterium sp. P9-64]